MLEYQTRPVVFDPSLFQSNCNRYTDGGAQYEAGIAQSQGDCVLGEHGCESKIEVTSMGFYAAHVHL